MANAARETLAANGWTRITENVWENAKGYTMLVQADRTVKISPIGKRIERKY